MKKNRKSVCAALTAVTVFAMGVTGVYAAAGEAGEAKQMPGVAKIAVKAETGLSDEQMQAMMTETAEQMKTAFAGLVADGVISQELADQMTNKQKMFKNVERPEMKDGEAAEGVDKGQKWQKFGNFDGSEKPERPDKENAALKAERPERANDEMKAERAEKAGIDMTTEQREAIFAAMQNAQKAAVDKLVADGTITSEQAEKMANFSVKREQ